MGLIKALIVGLIAGAIGAAVWAAIAYFTGYEIGWIAIGVGALVGVGVRLGAGEQDGWTPGVLAAALAVGSIVAGKYATVSILVNQVAGSYTARAMGESGNPEERAITACANEVCRERERTGQAISYPPGIDTWEDAEVETDYPADVWIVARQRWDKTPVCYRDAALHLPAMASQERRVSYMGHLIVEEGGGGYGQFTWPSSDVQPEYASAQDDFPTDLWASASDRYTRMDEAGHAQFAVWASDWLRRRVESARSQFSQQATSAGFGASFSLMDILWFFFAVGAAFKLGSGMASGE